MAFSFLLLFIFESVREESFIALGLNITELCGGNNKKQKQKWKTTKAI